MTRYEIKQRVLLANGGEEWIRLDVQTKEDIAWRHFDDIKKWNPNSVFALIRIDENVISINDGKGES